mmetsp:Transcript_6894/g.18717  ORF Transcript_6894/g.18717 Transcript_6894/m.18717 type:complete len:289 (-) Transcript_6894:300-1166(-)
MGVTSSDGAGCGTDVHRHLRFARLLAGLLRRMAFGATATLVLLFLLVQILLRKPGNMFFDELRMIPLFALSTCLVALTSCAAFSGFGRALVAIRRWRRISGDWLLCIVLGMYYEWTGFLVVRISIERVGVNSIITAATLAITVFANCEPFSAVIALVLFLLVAIAEAIAVVLAVVLAVAVTHVLISLVIDVINIIAIVIDTSVSASLRSWRCFLGVLHRWHAVYRLVYNHRPIFWARGIIQHVVVIIVVVTANGTAIIVPIECLRPTARPNGRCAILDIRRIGSRPRR